MDQKLNEIRSYLAGGGVRLIDMAECLRRGTVEIADGSAESALLCVPDGGHWLLSAETVEESDRLLAQVLEKCGEKPFSICIHQSCTLDRLRETHRITYYMECFQTMLPPGVLPEEPQGFEFRPLTPDMAEWVNKNYHDDPDSLDYMRFLLERGDFTGAYTDGRCVGFMGHHWDGSTGLLDVLPEHRRHGVAEALCAHCLRAELLAGNVPFGQVLTDNTASIALQHKLGSLISEERMWWLEAEPLTLE